MAGEWERYLRQQIELGGAEVVVSTAGRRGSGAAGQEAQQCSRAQGGNADESIWGRTAASRSRCPAAPLEAGLPTHSRSRARRRVAESCARR